MSGDADARAGADVLTALGGFTRTLRAAGVPVTPDRTAGVVRGCLEVDVTDRTAVYWAGRATLCGDPEHQRPYDLAFEAWFGGRLARPRRPHPHPGQRPPPRAPRPPAPPHRPRRTAPHPGRPARRGAGGGGAARPGAAGRRPPGARGEPHRG